MSEDISGLLKNFKTIVNSGNVPDNLKEILDNLSKNNNLNTDESNITTNNIISNSTNTFQQNQHINSSNNNSSSENNFNIDLETILKMKTIIDSINNKDDPRANLLYSLKPYLRDSKRKQLDQYVNLLKMTKIADIMKNDKKENNHNAK